MVPKACFSLLRHSELVNKLPAANKTGIACAGVVEWVDTRDLKTDPDENTSD